MAITVKNGTPVHGDSLCEACSNAHIERGFRVGEERVFCEGTYYPHAVLFPVRECSGYLESKRQTLRQMEKIAWVLSHKGNTRTAGFAPPGEVRENHGEWVLADED